MGSSRAASGRTLIGVAERIALPDWGVARLRVKIDTGAKTSALHVDDVTRLAGELARFTVVLDKQEEHRRVEIVSPITRIANVRSSSGAVEERVFVETRVQLGPIVKRIEISLASREPMIFRMLLGRSALRGDFVVDPARRYLARRKSPPMIVEPPEPVSPAKRRKKPRRQHRLKRSKKRAGR